MLNNPLLYTDISGEDFGLSLLIAVGTAILTNIGMSYYGQSPVNLGSMAQSIIFAVASAGLSYGVGSVLGPVGGFWKEALRATLHGLAQGAISGVTGGNFLSGFLAGAFSSATSSLAQSSGEFSVLRSRVGSDLFSAISGGLGAEIGGGNFFIGAIQGLAVNEFNHLMHKEAPDDGFKRNKNGTYERINGNGGDTTDYLYNENGSIIDSTPVNKVESTTSEIGRRSYGYKQTFVGKGMDDPSAEMFMWYAGGEVIGPVVKGIGAGLNFIKIPAARFAGSYIKVFAPRIGANRYLRIGISTSKGNQVFRITIGNNWKHLLDINLGKIPKLK